MDRSILFLLYSVKNSKIYSHLFFPDAYNEPVSFMTGSFDQHNPSHLSHHQDQYGAYGPYAVHPPLGSDSGGSSGYSVPIPGGGGFSPVAPGGNPLDTHHHHMAAAAAAEAWNNNERVETSYY